MPTKVIKLDTENIDSAKIEQAAQLIDDGLLVAFPTETVYGIACRVKTDSLAKLDKLKSRSPEKYYTLHIGQKDQLEKYLPTISLRVQKLVENAWPGPLTIVFELDPRDIHIQQNTLEKQVFENLYKDNSIGIRCPDNPVASKLLQLTQYPVVAPSANLAGQPPAVEPKQVLERFADRIELLLDAGPCKYKKSSTVVRIGKKGLEILRFGIFPQKELEEWAKIKFLFVCTGNTCRSPMAAGLFKKYLAEKLGCVVDHLERKGYKVFSAGTMGVSGVPASVEAVAACAVKGIDLRSHRSTALTKELIEDSDVIFVMSRMHQRRVVALSPEAADKCFLLAVDTEIPDPIGQVQQVYYNCAEMIEKALKKRISELVI